MNTTHQKIIGAVIAKAERVCPGALMLIGVYGSVRTGDTHEKSDLDLLILINDDSGRQLADGFILDDEQIGYDIYCTTWEMLEAESECRHAHLAKLLDPQIVYVADPTAPARLDALRTKATEVLHGEERFKRVDEILAEMKTVFADAVIADSLSSMRAHSARLISQALDAVMLYHGRYFKLGVKRTFDELAGLSLTEDFEYIIMGLIRATDRMGIIVHAAKLLRAVNDLVKLPATKCAPTKESMSGTYEEMYSNWHGKIHEAALRGDAYSSFMTLASLQSMLAEVGEESAIGEYDTLDDYSPTDLEANARLFDAVTNGYLDEYAKVGLAAKRFADVDEFVAAYLAE